MKPLLMSKGRMLFAWTYMISTAPLPVLAAVTWAPGIGVFKVPSAFETLMPNTSIVEPIWLANALSSKPLTGLVGPLLQKMVCPATVYFVVALAG
jgi:hypothetical protein